MQRKLQPSFSSSNHFCYATGDKIGDRKSEKHNLIKQTNSHFEFARFCFPILFYRFINIRGRVIYNLHRHLNEIASLLIKKLQWM